MDAPMHNPDSSPEERDDEDHDPHYVPQNRPGSVRSPRGASVKSATKRSVNVLVWEALRAKFDVSGPVQAICTITHATGKMVHVQYAHLIRSAKGSEELTKLEWSWDLTFYSLDHRSPLNLQPMRSGLHYFFDVGKNHGTKGWLLLPADASIIDAFWRAYVLPWQDGRPSPRINPETLYEAKAAYKYRVVAMDRMKQCVEFERYAINTEDIQRQTYTYPFDDFPPVWLSSPFHYVIANAGEKLRQVFGDDLPSPDQPWEGFSRYYGGTRLELRQVHDIYMAWMTSTPSREWSKLPALTTDASDSGAANSRRPRGGDNDRPNPQGPPPAAEGDGQAEGARQAQFIYKLRKRGDISGLHANKAGGSAYKPSDYVRFVGRDASDTDGSGTSVWDLSSTDDTNDTDNTDIPIEEIDKEWLEKLKRWIAGWARNVHRATRDHRPDSEETIVQAEPDPLGTESLQGPKDQPIPVSSADAT